MQRERAGERENAGERARAMGVGRERGTSSKVWCTRPSSSGARQLSAKSRTRPVFVFVFVCVNMNTNTAAMYAPLPRPAQRQVPHPPCSRGAFMNINMAAMYPHRGVTTVGTNLLMESGRGLRPRVRASSERVVSSEPDPAPLPAGTRWRVDEYQHGCHATQRATKEFSGPERPKVGYLIRSNPPTSLPYCLPKGLGMIHFQVIFQETVEVRCVVCTPTEATNHQGLKCRRLSL
jgi:hypothetical protein